MRLNLVERKVLAVLVEEYDSDGPFYTFAHIMRNGDLEDRKAVRRACRSLARKGLARYGRGLWTEDGEMFGSGYAATDAGLRLSPPETTKGPDVEGSG